MKEKSSAKPHNFLFKDVYSEKKYAMDLFRLTLTKKEFNFFDWKTLRVKSKPFFDESWDKKRADLIFSVGEKISGRKTEIFFLLEHKSYKSDDIFLQLLEYQIYIYRKNRIPVIPVVIYHGKRPNWHLPVNFRDFLEFGSSRMKKMFGKSVLNFRYRLLNIQKLNFTRKQKFLTSRPILFIMQNVWNLDSKKIIKLFTIGKEIAFPERKGLIERAANYIMKYDKRITLEDLKELEEQTSPNKGELIMSLMQRSLNEEREEGREEGEKKGREKGREEGREESKAKIALKMLEKRVQITTICEVVGFSEEQLKELQEKCRTKQIN